MYRTGAETGAVETRTGELPTSMDAAFPGGIEDLEGQAREAFRLSRSLCGSCRPYHAIYPFKRLAGRKIGVDADRDVLGPLLARIIADGARRILITGSADPGLLALVLSAARSHSVAITVVDLCPTPLATCRSFGFRHGIAIETQATCLSEMAFNGKYDLIFAHSVLSFIPSPLHGVVGERFRQALVHGGCLVMATSVSAKPPPVDEAVFCADVLSGLKANGIGLPASEPVFRRLLAGYSAVQRLRSSPAATVDELVAYLARHRLEVISLIPRGRMIGYKANGECLDHANAGVLVTARRV